MYLDDLERLHRQPRVWFAVDLYPEGVGWDVLVKVRDDMPILVLRPQEPAKQRWDLARVFGVFGTGAGRTETRR
jgi:hypothetical protein